ncbi:MAG: hypothetical protein B7Y99_04985 [Caulobacterales bacterium 32-69-10]|nr:MAG: hypothetical protein B7Y99_04985 [Caulobacterales bacterium 32-69-10]
MRRILVGGLGALTAWAGAAAGSGALAQGILVATDNIPAVGDLRACMIAARTALSGTGMVIQVSGGSVIGSNEERTFTVRCDVAGTVLFIEAFFPGGKDQLDPVMDAFKARAKAPLIASETKFHQYTVDCTRQTSCEIDPPAICKQAYQSSAKPASKVLNKVDCRDAQGVYACTIDYELNCS